jgi:hypothetical protein
MLDDPMYRKLNYWFYNDETITAKEVAQMGLKKSRISKDEWKMITVWLGDQRDHPRYE